MTPVLLIAIFAVAVIFSMLGLGGGILYVPILLAAGLPMHDAVAVSLAIMLVMSLTAAFIYHRNGLIDWKLFLLMEPASVIGALVGGYFSSIFPDRVLYVLFALSMIAAATLGRFSPQKILPPAPEDLRPWIFHLKKEDSHYRLNALIAVPVSMLAGFISSIIGLGGGFLKVPLMTVAFGVPIKIAAATSSAMIVVTSSTGFAGHAFAGHVNYGLAAALSVVTFTGALVGTKLLVKLDKTFLNNVLMVLQLSLAAWMVWKIFN
ncbi:MAG: sulfite exporter TauE/SafE family protein [Spirochaetia bacterium]|nr:sulfite exporter TauE/SafE family protein [Spirochaetia bacterium]